MTGFRKFCSDHLSKQVGKTFPVASWWVSSQKPRQPSKGCQIFRFQVWFLVVKGETKKSDPLKDSDL